MDDLFLPLYKAVALNIMFTAGEAYSRIPPTNETDRFDRSQIEDWAPGAAKELLEKQFHYVIPETSITKYFDELKENAKNANIRLDHDAVALHIGSLLGSVHETTELIEKDFRKVAKVFKKAKESKRSGENALSDRTVWLVDHIYINNAAWVGNGSKIMLSISWEKAKKKAKDEGKDEPPRSLIKDADLNDKQNPDWDHPDDVLGTP